MITDDQTRIEFAERMTTDEKLIMVLEWMGWHLVDGPRVDAYGSFDGVGPKTMKWIAPDGSYLHPWCQTREAADKRLPPLTLDWLHECVVYLRKHHPKLANKYYSNLHKSTKGQSSEIMIDLVEATKEQRLDALVATLGLSTSPHVTK